MSSRGGALVVAATALSLALVANAGEARADTWSDIGNPAPRDPDMDKRLFRSGVVVGLSAGYGLGAAEGYPNQASAIGDPSQYSATDLLHGGGGDLFVMGALADYVSFGFWFGGSSMQSGDWRSSGGGGGIRVEIFPLVALFPRLRDLGVSAQFGLGSATAHEKSGDYPDAHGVQSFAGAGLFYEWTIARALGGHVAAGPSLAYDGIWSQTIARSSALAGLRVAFYGGQ